MHDFCALCSQSGSGCRAMPVVQKCTFHLLTRYATGVEKKIMHYMMFCIDIYVCVYIHTNTMYK